MDKKQFINNQKMNLNGEFLGITSIGVYSAPWFLQLVLLLIIGAMFYYKMVNHSRSLKQDLTIAYNYIQQSPDLLESLKSYENKFLGFTTSKDNIPSYWGGFAIFGITLLYALLKTLTELTLLN